MKNIIFIGMMGCGKTTIATLIAKRLNREMIDIDQYLVDKHHMSIADMFAVSEDYFRQLETEACKDLANLSGKIISTGGGVIVRDENIDILKQNGIVIYLDRPLEHILSDVDIASRPLLKDGKEKIISLDKQRRPLYQKAMDIYIKNDRPIDEIIDDIILKIG